MLLVILKDERTEPHGYLTSCYQSRRLPTFKLRYLVHIASIWAYCVTPLELRGYFKIYRWTISFILSLSESHWPAGHRYRKLEFPKLSVNSEGSSSVQVHGQKPELSPGGQEVPSGLGQQSRQYGTFLSQTGQGMGMQVRNFVGRRRTSRAQVSRWRFWQKGHSRSELGTHQFLRLLVRNIQLQLLSDVIIILPNSQSES